MVLKCEPIFAAVEEIKSEAVIAVDLSVSSTPKVLLMSPAGRRLDHLPDRGRRRLVQDEPHEHAKDAGLAGDVHRGAAGGFPVHNTPQRLTKIGLQRNHKALIANRHHRILHHAAIRRHEIVEGPMHAIAHAFEALADVL